MRCYKILLSQFLVESHQDTGSLRPGSGAAVVQGAAVRSRIDSFTVNHFMAVSAESARLRYLGIFPGHRYSS